MIESRDLLALLDVLASAGTSPPAAWEGWTITPVSGGRNNRLLRAIRGHDDLAIKFTLRDATDRAGREYHGLRAIQEVAPTLGPVPLLLDRGRDPHPVIVQSWIAGKGCAVIPKDDVSWVALLARFTALHRIGPDTTAVPLPAAVFTANDTEDARRRIEALMAHLPPSEVSSEVRHLVYKLDQTPLPQWDPPRLALNHGDPNVRNFIRCSDGWAFVDWEYCGWGDPAFEIANLVAHPGNVPVPLARWAWVTERYAELCGDMGARTRVRTYCLMLAVGYAAYFANLGHQYDAGKSERERLVPQSPSRRVEIASHYRHYAAVATTLLGEW